MNQKEIWCVVNPSVGLPMFLGAVAVTSLIVHGAILTNTTWMGGYWQGGAPAAVSAVSTESAAPLADASQLPGSLVAATPVLTAAK